MVSTNTSGEAAAQALRALRRAAQLHTERRASVAKPGKVDLTHGRTRGRGRATLGSSQPDPVQCSQLSATQPSSQLPLSQAETLPGDKCGSQRDERDMLASMSTQTPSNMLPSSLDTVRASQVPLAAEVPKQAPAAAAFQALPAVTPEAPASVQAPSSGVAEAAAALAAALASFAGSGMAASQEAVRRRYRYKAPPPGRSSPQSSTRVRSPSSTPHPRKRKHGRNFKTQAEAIKEVSSKTIWASVGRLSEDIRNLEKEKTALRARCQKAAAEALRLLNEHQRACKESCEAIAGTTKAADTALGAVAALERQAAPSVALRFSIVPGHQGFVPAPNQFRKRVRRIDGIAAPSCI